MFNARNRWNYSTFGSQVFNLDAVSLDEGLVQRATYDTSTAAHVNQLYSATLYAQYNQEHNFYAALPQVDRTGMADLDNPVAKAFRPAHSPVQLDTHAEGGAISTARTFQVEEFNVDVKRSETVMEVSDLQQIESLIEDAVGMEEFMELQRNQLDLAVDRDGLADPVLAADSNYDARDKITELDRVIASQDEEANSDDVNDNPFADGDLDYGTIDRSADSWADSYVDHNGVAGNRQLTRDLMDNFLAGLGDFGDSDPYEDSIILTGRDSAKVLSDLMADSSRGTQITFDGTGGGSDDVNDAETQFGLPGTTRFRHYDGIPIVPNQNAPADGLSRIYVVPMDTIRGEPKVSVEQYAEPYFEEAGRGQAQGYIAQGEYKEKALWLLNHEVVVRDFASTGKLRDIQE